MALDRGARASTLWIHCPCSILVLLTKTREMRDSDRALPASEKKAEGRMEKKGTVLLEVVVGGVVRRGGGSRGGGALGHLPCGGLGGGDKASKAVASIQPGSSVDWLRESSRSGMRLRVGG